MASLWFSFSLLSFLMKYVKFVFVFLFYSLYLDIYFFSISACRYNTCDFN